MLVFCQVSEDQLNAFYLTFAAETIIGWKLGKEFKKQNNLEELEKENVCIIK